MGLINDTIWQFMPGNANQYSFQIFGIIAALIATITLLLGPGIYIRIWDKKKLIWSVSISLENYNNSYLYSFAINFAYGLGLSIFSGYIIYYNSVLHGIDVTWCILILSAYFVVELRGLFYEDAIKDPYHLTTWRALPTIGILAATPLAFLFTLVYQRRLSLFSIEGLLNIWATTRYNIVDPRWQRPNEDNTTFIGGPRNRTLTHQHKHAHWIYRLLDGLHTAKNQE